jgi:ribonuclease HI
VFTSDSKYIIEGMSSWVRGWMMRGWTRKAGPIENLELWQDAVESLEGHEVAWNWVRGHNGHPQNEYANFLATRAAAQQTSSPGFVPSGFDAWLEEQRAKSRGGLTAPLEPFPEAQHFHASPRLPTEAAERR